MGRGNSRVTGREGGGEVTRKEAEEFGLRPPYVTETAAEYFRGVVDPFIKQSKVGFSDLHTASSYRCYHWFRGPNDKYSVFMREIEVNEVSPTK